METSTIINPTALLLTLQGLALDNAIEGLLAVSYSKDAATQSQAVGALRLMSAHFPNMRRIIEMNALDSLEVLNAL